MATKDNGNGKRDHMDPLLMHHTVTCKDDPEMLALLMGEEAGGERSANSIQQIRSAARSIGHWARNGFAKVSDEQYRLRLDICLSCNHLHDPGLKMQPDLNVPSYRAKCGLCGCPLRRKAKMATENCPDTSFSQSGRWPTV